MKRKPQRDSRPSSTRAIGTRAERRALWHYRLRGFRILATNIWIAGYELDVIARRGGLVVFCEVKAKSSGDLGDPLEMVGPEKERRVRRAAEAWLAANPEHADCEVSFEIVTSRAGRLERLSDPF